jgi:hypothetical protein
MSQVHEIIDLVLREKDIAGVSSDTIERLIEKHQEVKSSR